MEPQIELLGIDSELYQRVESIVSLQLGSVLINLSSLKVKVTKSQKAEKDRPSFHCELVGKLEKGPSLEVTMFGSGLNICVADATARLSRLIKKEVRNQHLGSRQVRQKVVV